MTLDFQAAIRAESDRFLDVLSGTDPEATVPPCPDWTAADLLWHLGEVQWFWGRIVRDRVADPSSLDAPDRPDSYAGLLDFFAAGHDTLVTALAGTDDTDEVWTWFPADHSAGFVRRRQAHEALIHRLDAELTAGAVTGFVTELAADGVKEVLDWMYSGVPEWGAHTMDGAAGRITVTDTGATWLARLGRWSGTSPRTGTQYTNEPTITIVDSGEPVFSVSGPARDLDAWLWNRPTLAEVSREGDTAAFEAVIRDGVQ